MAAHRGLCASSRPVAVAVALLFATGLLLSGCGLLGGSKSRQTTTQPTTLTTLSPAGLGNITLNMTPAEIRRTRPDFPAVTPTGRMSVTYQDCDFGFLDDQLVSIAPRDGGRTVDGVQAGVSLARATELYGQPVSVQTNPDGTKAVIYVADLDTEAAYYILVDQFADQGGQVSGVVKSVALCRCAGSNGE